MQVYYYSAVQSIYKLVWWVPKFEDPAHKQVWIVKCSQSGQYCTSGTLEISRVVQKKNEDKRGNRCKNNKIMGSLG